MGGYDGAVSTAAFVALGLTIAISAFIQGATGLGFAMISAPVIALVDASLIPIVLLVLMVPLNGYIAYRERHALDWRGAGWVSVGRVTGTFGGLWILLAVTGRGVSLLIGWTIVAAVAIAIVSPAFTPSRSALGVVGALSGVTETATGVGGPPVALAYQHSPGPTLRSTMALTFLIGEIVSLIVLAFTGIVEASTLVMSLWLLPFLILGAGLSALVHHRLDGPLLRWLVLGFSGAAGIVVLLTA